MVARVRQERARDLLAACRDRECPLRSPLRPRPEPPARAAASKGGPVRVQRRLLERPSRRAFSAPQDEEAALFQQTATRLSRRPRSRCGSWDRCNTSTGPGLAAGPHRQWRRRWPRRRSQRRPRSRRRGPSDTSRAGPTRRSRRDRLRHDIHRPAAIDPTAGSMAIDPPARPAVDPTAVAAVHTDAAGGSVTDDDGAGGRRAETGERYRHADAFDQTRPNHGVPPCSRHARAPTQSPMPAYGTKPASRLRRDGANINALFDALDRLRRRPRRHGTQQNAGRRSRFPSEAGELTRSPRSAGGPVTAAQNVKA